MPNGEESGDFTENRSGLGDIVNPDISLGDFDCTFYQDKNPSGSGPLSHDDFAGREVADLMFGENLEYGIR